MSRWSRTILNLLFPPYCQGCGKDDAWLCQACLNSIPLLQKEGDIASIAPYANPIARKLITNYKYSGARCLEESLRALLKRYASEVGKPDWTELKELTIVSVPTSESRLRERGFDHAAVIAQIVKEEWAPQASIKKVLKRSKQILSNAKLEDEKARQANVSGAFEALEKVSGPVLLLDDVYTTGATTNECYRVLKQAGAESLYIFTLAKG